MSPAFEADPQRQPSGQPTALAALADGPDEPWGYECALPFLQAIDDSPEPGTHGWPRVAVR